MGKAKKFAIVALVVLGAVYVVQIARGKASLGL